MRYAVTGVGVRVVDAGAGLALLLLADDRIRSDSAARTGGLLVALFTLPHLAGPLLARRLDLARDHRRLLSAAYAVVGVLLSVTACSLGRVPTPVVAVVVMGAGLGGPMLTGGLSSRLADLVPADDVAQRRAQGMDAAIYGVAATAGPALVGVLSREGPPALPLLALGGTALVSAAVVRTLPRTPARDTASVPRVRAVLPLVLIDPPLRRVNYATMVTAAALAGLTVVSVQLATTYGVGAGAAAVLLAAMGAGNLVGSLVLSVRPLAGEPELLTTRHVALVAACLGLCAWTPTFGWGVLGFALTGAATAPFATATFAARNTYAPSAARGQVFVTMAGLKLVAASGGTALAGFLVVLGPRALLVGAGAAVAATAVATLLDRRMTQSSGVEVGGVRRSAGWPPRRAR